MIELSPLTLNCRDTVLELNPHLGGSIARLLHKGRDYMRRTPDDAKDVLQTASFPLVPFCNRIKNGQFAMGTHKVALKPNLGDHPHTLHGQGWLNSWRVSEQGPSRVVLTYRHEADEWPWTYEARQVFELRPGGLRVWLSVKNLSPTAMPAGLGFHPYFNRTPLTRLKSQLDGVWMADAECLPTELHAGIWRKDWTGGDFVTDSTLIDHCHTGFTGRADIYEGAQPTLTLRASPDCHWLHIYVPPGEDYFCAEPVNHMPDPFNHANSGLRCLKPQAVAMVWMDLTLHG
ncbi:aldose 1-epimerase [Asticcacaulis sp. YBE204]|uniref:aldose 1-epimerase n=1 Tax=Asticcacaulis sp. YBE204 TaxID=1282363 RepID=UPI0003C3FE17|nr:aldose 1-epimerase [Asticcacaulis sp. YBE204]ESQ79720.1 aldose 1-epimerase [Asticcacaulis sp. YBE204]